MVYRVCAINALRAERRFGFGGSEWLTKSVHAGTVLEPCRRRLVPDPLRLEWFWQNLSFAPLPSAKGNRQRPILRPR